jgi:hypothetical protein
MTTMKNLRRALAALLLAITALTSAPASADMAPPPVTLHVVGQAARVDASAPDRATFELRNTGSDPIDVFLFRAILREGTSFPLPIARVEIDGREVGRTVTVPPGATTRVTVFFELPEAFRGRGRWDVELRVQASGWGATDSQPATLSRGGASQRKWTLPKA